MARNRLASLAALCGLLAAVTGISSTAAASDRDDPLPRVPPGFAVSLYQHVGGAATSLAFGPDTRDKTRTRLYVTDYLAGSVVAIDDVGGAAGTRSVFATGLRNPLGVVVAKDGTVFVADSEAARPGPFGTRVYGRVWRLTDTDENGTADKQEVVLKDLPNGRHNTNGLALGIDGLLYVANGNATDDGVEGGNPEAKPWSGSIVRVSPRATNLSLANAPKGTLVAHGMRNPYDLAFSPFDPSELFIPMNGLDDARQGSTGGNPGEELENSDDLLFVTDTGDRKVDDFGFPSCLYNEERQGNLKPYDNPNPMTIEQFGPCPKTVPPPVMSFGTHVSADGLAFQATDAWGKSYVNDLFVAEFGNFFGVEPVGHKVVRVELDRNGNEVVRHSEFLSGTVPLDVTFDAAGAMFVADFSGAIYKVVRVVEVPEVVEVPITGYQYVPQVLVVPEGTTVRWINNEALGLVHNVTGQAAIRTDGSVDDGKEINSGDLGVGASHEFRFDTPGVWVYTCSLGPVHTALMHGVVEVVPAGG